MSHDLSGYRVVAVHAHPDDETLATGGTLAQLARRGAKVTVITCTLGEEGEVIGDTYQQLIADEANQLGGFRIGELGRALENLGVEGEFLGGAGHFRDSGMVGSPAHEHPRAFVNSGEEAVRLLAQRFEELDPHLVITYGPDGGYGHPDHIRAHEITHAAHWIRPVPRIVWAVADRKVIDTELEAIDTVPSGWIKPGPGELAAVDKIAATVRLSESDYHKKREAMGAHATQIWVADGRTSITNPRAALATQKNGLNVYALSNLLAQPLLDVEHFQLGAGVKFSSEDPDLIEGL